MKNSSKKRKALLGAMITSALLLYSVPTYAEEVKEFALDEVVVTADRVPTKITEVTTNVSVITREEIENGHFRNIGEALSHIPGVNVVSDGTPGSISAAYINGTEKVLILVDGRRMNLPNGIGGMGGATINLTDITNMENIDRVEIVKGASSALYGADAVGGVINIITKKGLENKTYYSVSAGNWNRNVYSFTNQGKDEDFSWYFTAKKEHLGDYKTGDGDEIKYTGYDGKAYTLRLDQKVNKKDNLTFVYENLITEKEGKAVNKYHNNEQNNLDVTYSIQNSSKVDSMYKLYQNKNHRYGVDYTSYDHDVKTQGFNSQFNIKTSSDHLLTTGFDWRKDNINSSEYGDKDATTKAIYIQDKWDASSKVSITTGVRYDDNNKYGDNTSPHIAMNYKFNEKTNYYTSWGKIFRAPRFDDLYWPHSQDPADAWYPGSPETHYDGNPNLKAEEGYGIELGINHNFDNKTKGSISYFSRQLDDAIAWKETVVGAVHYWMPTNVNKQKASGIEVKLAKNFNTAMSGYVAYNHTNIEEQTEFSNGYIKDKNAPDHTWNIGLDYTENKLNAGIKGTAVLGRTNSSFNESGYWLWDANLSYKVSKNYNAFITVRNLFDTYYQQTATQPCGGRTFLIGINGNI